MASKVDRQAGAHIERLFHAPNCRVWERLGSTVPIHPGDIPIQCADGDVISVAHSAEVADEWDVSDIAAAFNRAAPMPTHPEPQIANAAWGIWGTIAFTLGLVTAVLVLHLPLT